MTTTNNSCSVTNSVSVPVTDATSAQTGWDGSIVAINAYNTGSGTAQGYEQTLALLPFANDKDSLSESATSTITLDQVLDDVSVTLYDLIFAQSNNLFPVLETSEMLGFVEPYTYPAITVTSADSSSCANALLFYQNICSFPSSTLAKNFQSALSSTSSDADSSDDIDTSISEFFASTKDYQNVTFSSYIAVTTYLTTFANAWANFASSYTYYLYQSSGSSPSSGTNTGAKSAGTITFAKASSTGVPSVTDTNGGYTITYSDTKNNRTTLTFSDGQLVSSTTEDIPTICLQCTYTELSQFSGQASDASTLVPIVFGNANGQQVIGIYYKEPTNSNWLLSVENFFNSGGVQLCMQILGVVMGLKMMYDGLSWLKNKFTKNKQENEGDDPNEEQIADAREELPQVQEQMQAEQEAVADRLDMDDTSFRVAGPEDIEGDMDTLQTAIEQEEVEEEVNMDMEEVNLEAQQITLMGEVEVTEGLEEAATNVREAMEDLQAVDASNISEAAGQLSKAETLMGQADGEIETAETQLAKDLSSSEQSSINEAQQAQEEEEQEEDEEEDAEDNVEKGGDEEDFEIDA